MEKKLSWFCLRSKQKNEHIAAGHLKNNLGLEVFAPRIRFKRATQRGAAWVTDALFPSYLFARYDLHQLSHVVHYSPGIKGVVHFGGKWPTIPDDVIEDLRRIYADQNVHVIDPLPEAGDSVQIAGGAFHGLRAVVTRVMSSRERVAVLLDFLGRQTMVEVDVKDVVKETVIR